MFIRGPHSHGPNAPLDRNVRETGVCDPALEEGSGTGLQASLTGGFEKDGVEVFGGEVGGEGIVRRSPFLMNNQMPWIQAG